MLKRVSKFDPISRHHIDTPCTRGDPVNNKRRRRRRKRRRTFLIQEFFFHSATEELLDRDIIRMIEEDEERKSFLSELLRWKSEKEVRLLSSLASPLHSQR